MATQETTSNDKSGLSELETKQVGILFSTIADLASRADRLCCFAPRAVFVSAEKTNSDNVEQLEITVDQLRDVCTRIGVLADLGAKKTNEMQMNGGIEGWLLPPIYPANP